MKKEITQQRLWYLIEKKEVPDILGHTVISPMHYGDTIEIHLNRGFEGEAIINGQHFPFKEKNIYFIPPRYPHSYIYTKGGSDLEDIICAFHINVEMLKPILDIEKVLQADNLTLLSFTNADHDFDRIWNIVTNILRSGNSFSIHLSELISLFDMLNTRSDIQNKNLHYNPSVIQIVDWVEKVYPQKLTIRHAAAHFGFSDCYFCKWFKKQTGSTFNEYISAVRISHACTYLQAGLSVAATAERCGFYDSSYFIKVFRHHLGVTPLEYLAMPKRQRHFIN